MKKKELKEKMIAGFTTAMYATSNVLAAYGGAKPANVDYDALFADGQKNAMLFAYKFSLEQEVEADIIAYRFPDYIGYGGEYYIHALELLRNITPNGIHFLGTCRMGSDRLVGYVRCCRTRLPGYCSSGNPDCLH